ncbi:HDOD domain-containing protein [Crenobacter sp. SG2303]|uniref:HDOD domain-containing protein n=1 Tax=Crenobacter oryzisoli TaxID=3056844 RepID=A0ABT7XJQ1_9NEIS|nr:HDOD domain-containing protein [Crenobacter sp. SG2303]MDN0073970.1 HDOD domain-containing protein [Crenobacter sp. SG2303]
MLKHLIEGLTSGFGRQRETEPSTETSAGAGMSGAGTGVAEPLPSLGFVSHQPLYDKQLRVVAYAFSVRRGKGPLQSALQQAEFDRLMLGTLKNLDIGKLLAYRKAFVPVSLHALDDALLTELPAKSVIYRLEPPLVGEALDGQLLARLDRLQGHGYRFAVEPARFDAEQGELFRRMDFFIVDFAAPAPQVLEPFLEQLPQRYPKARWIGFNIGSAEELDLCLHGVGSRQFALFHGAILPLLKSLDENERIDTEQLHILEIMRLLRANTDSGQIEAQFKRDSVLLFKLLRFINTPSNGFAKEVQTIEESLLLLGRETLFKWLSMLLFTAKQECARSFGLLEKSLIRARFMEKLGDVRSKVEREQLFVTGMFSVLDALLGKPLDVAIEPLDLPAPVQAALLHHSGAFADRYALALACEAGDAERIDPLVQRLQLSPVPITQHYAEAVLWAQEILQQGTLGDADA